MKKKEPVTGTGRNEMNVADIAHAPWNPRTTAELQPDHPAMADLVESVRALGVVQPIAVWIGERAAEIAGDGRCALCIAGNRRLEAARIVGLVSIPTHVFNNLTEEEARAITRAENECRFGVTPLADAKLIREMVELGRNQSEIAALVGVSEATICRRAKLLDLTPKSLEAVEGHEVDVKVLERLAAHPAEIQDRVAGQIKRRLDCGERISIQTAEYILGQETRDIMSDTWFFDGPGGAARRQQCVGCPNCTGNIRELFDLAPSPVQYPGSRKGAADAKLLGKCLNKKCYGKMEAAARDEIIDAAIAASAGGGYIGPREKVTSTWDPAFNSLRARKRSRACPVPWVEWQQYTHTADVKWGPPRDKMEAAERERRAKERKEADKKHKEWVAAEDAVREFFQKLFGLRDIPCRYILPDQVDCVQLAKTLKAMDADRLVGIVAPALVAFYNASSGTGFALFRAALGLRSLTDIKINPGNAAALEALLTKGGVEE